MAETQELQKKDKEHHRAEMEFDLVQQNKVSNNNNNRKIAFGPL